MAQWVLTVIKPKIYQSPIHIKLSTNIRGSEVDDVGRATRARHLSAHSQDLSTKFRVSAVRRALI